MPAGKGGSDVVPGKQDALNARELANSQIRFRAAENRLRELEASFADLRRSWIRDARRIERSRTWRLGNLLIRLFRLLSLRRPVPSQGPAELAASIESASGHGEFEPSTTVEYPARTHGRDSHARRSSDLKELERLARQRKWLLLRSCQICNGRVREIGVYREQVGIARCSACGILFLNPRPPSNRYAPGHACDRYLPRLVAEGVLSDDCTPNPGRILARYPGLVALAQAAYSRGPAIDVGCGIGLSTLALIEAGIPARGIELEEEFAEIARDRFGLEVEVGDLLATPAAQQPAQLVTLNSVLEHVADPVTFLAVVRTRLLANDGQVVITVPNMRSTQFVVEPDWDILVSSHLWYFDEDSLALVAAEAGLSIVTYWRDHRPLTGRHARVGTYVHDVLGLPSNVRGGVAGLFEPVQEHT